MGNILVHEFTTLDGVIGAPTWTFDFGFDPLAAPASIEDEHPVHFGRRESADDVSGVALSKPRR